MVNAVAVILKGGVKMKRKLLILLTMFLVSCSGNSINKEVWHELDDFSEPHEVQDLLGEAEKVITKENEVMSEIVSTMNQHNTYLENNEDVGVSEGLVTLEELRTLLHSGGNISIYQYDTNFSFSDEKELNVYFWNDEIYYFDGKYNN